MEKNLQPIKTASNQLLRRAGRRGLAIVFGLSVFGVVGHQSKFIKFSSHWASPAMC
jgi:uncharacterized protein YacL